MTYGTTIYEAAKYWLPLLSICTLVYRAYRKATRGITMWADKLMLNHLTHIQTATEKSATLLEEVRDDGKRTIELTIQVARDLKDHQAKDDQIQGNILRDLAVLKDR